MPANRNPHHFPKLTRRPVYSNYTTFSEYRYEVREDCKGRCVYCDGHENELKGIEKFTLDHFRPQSKFPALAHDPTNLVWACNTCNNLKRDIWLTSSMVDTVDSFGRGFIDSFQLDPYDYFEVLSDGQLKPLKDPAKYIIYTLKLNRIIANKIREKRNNSHKRAEKLLESLQIALARIDKLIDGTTLSIDERGEIILHRQEYQESILEELCFLEPDFTLS